MPSLEEKLLHVLPHIDGFDSFVHGLLAETLGWQIAQGVSAPDEIAYDWRAEDLEAEGLSGKIVEGRVWQIQPLPVDQQPWGVFLLEFAHPDAFIRGRGVVGPLRQVLRGLVPRRKRRPDLPAWRHENLLFICTHGWRHFTFAHFKGDNPASAPISTFGWVQGQAGWRTLCEANLPAIQWPDDPSDRASWHAQWSSAFDKEALTKRFFKQFRELCGLVADDIARRNRLNEAEANTEAQVLLERLLFLYFIQRKGWLDQKADYFFREFKEKHSDRSEDTSYYHQFLSVVFRRLSSRQMRREGEIGHLPFLNGGLFEEDPGAFQDGTTLRLGLKVGNGVLARVFDELLEHYNFTVREDTPLDQDVAVDPEMLGKILECLILEMESAEGESAPDRRKATGSYYTPRIVVHFICREVLRQFLLARLASAEGGEHVVPPSGGSSFGVPPSGGLALATPEGGDGTVAQGDRREPWETPTPHAGAPEGGDSAGHETPPSGAQEHGGASRSQGSMTRPGLRSRRPPSGAASEALSEPSGGAPWGQRLNRLFAIDPSAGIRAEEMETLRALLTHEDAQRIRRLLYDIRACDPAVGSGAFAVGLLHELVNLVILCDTREAGKDPRIHQRNYLFERKLHFIENAIYGVDFLDRAAEICKLRLWLSLIVDYELPVDPFECSPAKFAAALDDVPPLPNLDFKIRRGDSLLDQIHGHPIRMDLFAQGEEARSILRDMQDLKDRFFHAQDVRSKRSLQRKLLGKKLDLAALFIRQELDPNTDVNLGLFGLDESEAEKRRRRQEEKVRLLEALADVGETQRQLARVKPGVGSLSAADEEELRKLEGQSGPISFVWHVDFMEVFNRPYVVPPSGGSSLVVPPLGGSSPQGHPRPPGQDRRPPKGGTTNATQPSGFDIMVGNPPFVTARNPERREQYRQRWPLVCYQKYSLVAPFFQCSFGLLAPGGHLGFIVSNAFAKREFGKPLVEQFFPTVDLTKVVDCSGLMFPGHGTPTCIVFGRHGSPNTATPLRVAAILPGGGDLHAQPEESPLWHALAREHDHPGYDDGRVVVHEVARRTLLRWPMSFDLTGASTVAITETGSEPILNVLGDRVGPCTMTNADEVFVLAPDVARRSGVPVSRLLPFQEGDEVRDWSLHNASWLLNVYGHDCEIIEEGQLGATVRGYLSRFREVLENRVSFGNQTFKELRRVWYSYERMNANKYRSGKFLTYGEIATHGHFVYAEAGRIFERDSMVANLPPKASAEDHLLLAGLLNSSAALFWLKQVCFSKRESSQPEADTYYVFAGGKVEGLPVPGVIAAALTYRGRGAGRMRGSVVGARCSGEEREAD